jgi:hypothetical protein
VSLRKKLVEEHCFRFAAAAARLSSPPSAAAPARVPPIRSWRAGRRIGRSTTACWDRAHCSSNPPLIGGIAFTRQGRCQEREEVLGTTKPPYTLALAAACSATRLRGRLAI